MTSADSYAPAPKEFASQADTDGPIESSAGAFASDDQYSSGAPQVEEDIAGAPQVEEDIAGAPKVEEGIAEAPKVEEGIAEAPSVPDQTSAVDLIDTYNAKDVTPGIAEQTSAPLLSNTSAPPFTNINGTSAVSGVNESDPTESAYTGASDAKKNIPAAGSSATTTSRNTVGKKEGSSFAEKLKRRVSSNVDKSGTSRNSTLSKAPPSSTKTSPAPVTANAKGTTGGPSTVSAVEKVPMTEVKGNVPPAAVSPTTLSQKETATSLGAEQPSILNQTDGASGPPRTPSKSTGAPAPAGAFAEGTPASAKTNDFKTAPSTPSSPSNKANSGTPGTDRKRTKSGFFAKLKNSLSSPK